MRRDDWSSPLRVRGEDDGGRQGADSEGVCRGWREDVANLYEKRERTLPVF